MSALSILKDILRLGRWQTAALSGVVPILGYLLSSGGLGANLSLIEILDELAVLGLLGLTIHMFGFTHNEYSDLRYDLRNPGQRDKPLVTGQIGIRRAKIYIGGSFIVLLSSIMLFHLYFDKEAATLLLVSSVLFGVLYNLAGKRRPGMDVLLALWVLLLFLAGGSAAGRLPARLYFFGAMLALQIIYNNQIEGGLKDVKGDRKAGARTAAVALGVRRGDGEDRRIPVTFRALAWSHKIALVFSGFYVLFRYREARLSGVAGLILLGVMAFFGLSMFLLQFRSLGKDLTREQLLRIFSLHEISTVCFIYTAAVPFIGVEAVLPMFVIPLVWYTGTNKVLYGTFLVPNV